MTKELSFRCEVRRREHGGWIYWIYRGDDPRESSTVSYASEREALLAGYQRMEQLQPTPNPISTDTVDEPSTDQASGASAKRIPGRSVLPKDLPTAITYLEDEEFDRLFRATVDEARRRGRVPNSVEVMLETTSAISEQRRKRPSREAVAVPLTRGQVNAVRAAFKAGITPSRIARQFGLSQSDVRKALVSPELKR